MAGMGCGWSTHVVMELDFRLIFPEEFITGLLDEGLREDGRGTDQIRTTTINTGSISSADGSCVVRTGGSCVTCGIKAELGNPSQNQPKQGFIVCNIELASVTSSQSHMTTSAISQTIYDILIGSKYIDLDSLCVSEEQLCWVLYVDVMCLSVDGSLLDISLLSVVTALKDVQLPSVNIESGMPKVSLEILKPLSLGPLPTCITFGLHNKWSPLVDPTEEEKALCNGLMTISFTNTSMIAGLYKFGGVSLSSDSLQRCMKIAKKHCTTYHKLIESTLNCTSI